MTVLSLKNVNVNFGKRQVVTKASFEIKAGELIGLIGPNGAGKTSLMRACIGLVPASGAIKLGEHYLNELSIRDRAKFASFLPQQRVAHWAMSVENVIALGRAPYRARLANLSEQDKEYMEQAMSYMDITHLRHRSVQNLSGGELARVLIARSLAQNTLLLLADEPTAGLDPAHQIALMENFANLAQEGHTILVSMHDLSLASRWCNRVIIMNKSKVVADGTPEQVLSAESLADIYGITARILQDEKGFIIVPMDLTSNEKE